MGILIRIRKYDEFDHIFRYKVHGEDCGGITFYMDIDTSEKKLKFYRNPDATGTLSTIDLIKLNGIISDIPGVITSNMLGRVCLMGYNAFKNNDFPIAIDYAA